MQRNQFMNVNSRYIPPGATKIADKQSDAIAYLFTSRNGKPAMVVYYGKQSKPVAHFHYRTEAERNKRVLEYFTGRQASIKAKIDYKAKRLAPNALKLGDILSTCWGYDQTNREFYEVVEVIGQHVMIRELAQARTEEGFMQGRCVPQSGQYRGTAFRKLVQYGNSVKIESYITASKWNTDEVAGVKTGPALDWTSYA